MATATPADWLTLDDIAADLQVSLETVYQWRKKRTGPRGHKFGRHVRVRRRDYEQWLAARADRAGDAA